MNAEILEHIGGNAFRVRIHATGEVLTMFLRAGGVAEAEAEIEAIDEVAFLAEAAGQIAP